VFLVVAMARLSRTSTSRLKSTGWGLPTPQAPSAAGGMGGPSHLVQSNLGVDRQGRAQLDARQLLGGNCFAGGAKCVQVGRSHRKAGSGRVAPCRINSSAHRSSAAVMLNSGSNGMSPGSPPLPAQRRRRAVMALHKPARSETDNARQKIRARCQVEKRVWVVRHHLIFCGFDRRVG